LSKKDVNLQIKKYFFCLAIIKFILKMINPFRRSYQTLNLITIKSKALLDNYSFWQKQNPQAKIAPVLKSNAYGHGLELIGRFIDQKMDPSFIAVDSLYEAWKLEKAGVKTPILVIGYTVPDNFKIRKKLKFHLPVFDFETALTLLRYQPQTRLHLKIDTGMNRLGIKPNQVNQFISFLKNHQAQEQIVGIYSHLASAVSDQDFTRRQVKTFKKVIAQFEQAGFSFNWKHIAATAGSLTVKDPEFNLVRLGLGFYGYSPFSNSKKTLSKLEPALKLTSQIIQTKEVAKGEIVSYGGQFRAPKKMLIGVLPIGYYDGLDRRLSGRGQVKIGRKFCPLLGRICMNIAMVDLSGLKKPFVGQKITVISNRPKDKNSLVSLASLVDTIPYDLLVGLAESTRRVLW
jgi:alanine racemase